VRQFCGSCERSAFVLELLQFCVLFYPGMIPRSNPAAGKAGLALVFAFLYHCTGLPEPGR
jgi:hypothetical protein